MTPREALDVLRGLVEAGKRFGAGEVIIDISPHMDTMNFATVGDNHRIQQRRPWSVEGHPRYSAAAAFIARSANARPALETLAGCVVVSRNTAHILLAAAKVAQSSGELAGVVDDEPFRAAITEAEEAMR